MTVVSLCVKKAKAGAASCFAMKQVLATAKTKGARALAVAPGYASGPAGGYTPGDLATAYRVNPDTATTQTVAIVDAYDDPNALTDLNTFDAKYGLAAETSTSFRKVAQDGSTHYPTPNAGWAGEISLDLDAVRGVCHHCNILLVEATSSSFSDLAASENEAYALGARIISNSYGGAESGTIPSTISAAYNHPNAVITASAGDDGYYDWDRFNAGGASSNAPELPSSLATVVAVGGTTLYLNPDATRAGETVWNENGSADVTGYNLGASMGAGGGGCSTQVTAPRWQTYVANYAQTGCVSKRLATDIAALADPYTGYDVADSYQTTSTWATFGGTSLAAPLIAGMWGLAGGSLGVTQPALSLYGRFQSDTSKPLYDVTTGGNGFCDGTPAGPCAASHGSPNLLGGGVLDCAFMPNSATVTANTRACDAATGFDGPSGVGTPSGLNAFKPMPLTARITLPASLTHGVSATFSGATSSDPYPGGTLVKYTWTWGDGVTTTTATASVTHTYATAGTYTLKLTVTDYYGKTATVTVSVKVN